MTREQFLNGASFKVKGFVNYKGAETYRLDGGSIVRESRSSVDERVITYSHHCNVDTIGKVQFTGFTYVFNKKIKVKYRFEDLERFGEEA